MSSPEPPLEIISPLTRKPKRGSPVFLYVLAVIVGVLLLIAAGGYFFGAPVAAALAAAAGFGLSVTVRGLRSWVNSTESNRHFLD